MNTKPKLGLELALALALLLVGVLALPAIIFTIGSKLFGAYSNAGKLSLFYSNFAKDLGSLGIAAWAIALGPWVLITLVRLIVGAFPFKSPATSPPSKRDRVEPAIRS